jgi:YaaC-like Protein
MASDWYEIKFIESATNVRQLIQKSTGRALNAGAAREIAICIQQGRLYFEAAAGAPIQIKPLLIYYGIVSFAQAIIVARTGNSLSTLKRAHGLTDTTQPNASVESLQLRVESNGTFQEFNDTIAPLGRIWYYDEHSMPQWYEKPFDPVDVLSNRHITICDILARTPGLSNEFSQTFESPAKTIQISLFFQTAGACQLRIDDPIVFADRANLVTSVRRLRTEYPFLAQWRFAEATHAWGNSVIFFDNTTVEATDDLSAENLIEANVGSIRRNPNIDGSQQLIPAEQILPPLSGGYVGLAGTNAMQPINGARLNEYSLQFLGSFLLSSLVRYRPQIWQHAISRSFTAQSPADDRSLSIIEKFLNGVLSDFPSMVVRIVDYKRTR